MKFYNNVKKYGPVAAIAGTLSASPLAFAGEYLAGAQSALDETQSDAVGVGTAVIVIAALVGAAMLVIGMVKKH